MEMNKTIDTVIGKAVELLRPILSSNRVDQGHDIEHSVIVVKHIEKALSCESEFELNDEEKMCILLAGLLHDADDHKFFPEHRDYENARNILEQLKPLITDRNIELIIRMISYVSCSQNRNQLVKPEWLLYPRYADRLEALGEIGVLRAYIYGQRKRSPIFLDETPRTSNREQLYSEIATPDRFANYMGSSLSFVDHFYDKLLHLNDLGVSNLYFVNEFARRHQMMENFILEFGRTGQIDMNQINQWARKYGYEI